jgi:low temperature requirement protein LtrA
MQLVIHFISIAAIVFVSLIPAVTQIRVFSKYFDPVQNCCSKAKRLRPQTAAINVNWLSYQHVVITNSSPYISQCLA